MMKKSIYMLSFLVLALNGAVLADVLVKDKTAKPVVVAKKTKTDVVSQSMTTGVDVGYRLSGKPQIGSPLTIQLELTSPRDGVVTMTAGEGLSLSQPNSSLMLSAGQVKSSSITVVPQVEGLLYVNVFSTVNGRKGSMAIPVQVGEAKQLVRDDAQPAPSRDRMVSVPAK
jgi:hypothetical protein